MFISGYSNSGSEQHRLLSLSVLKVRNLGGLSWAGLLALLGDLGNTVANTTSEAESSPQMLAVSLSSLCEASPSCPDHVWNLAGFSFPALFCFRPEIEGLVCVTLSTSAESLCLLCHFLSPSRSHPQFWGLGTFKKQSGFSELPGLWKTGLKPLY